jgi:hypothetical protein
VFDPIYIYIYIYTKHNINQGEEDINQLSWIMSLKQRQQTDNCETLISTEEELGGRMGRFGLYHY